MTTRYTVTTGGYGYRSDSDYSDITSVGDIETAVIDRIVLWYRDYITAMTVHHIGSAQPAVTRGRGSGTMTEVVLQPGEWISRIEGSYRPEVISSLTFLSNTGRTWGPFGNVSDTEFIMDPRNKVPAHIALRMGFLYFSGCCDENYIRLLQATFAEYPGPGTMPGTLANAPHAMLKFKRESGAEPNAQPANILSTFTRDLMSPIITLHIGPEKTTLRAYEAILCRLPFFKAALQGEFKEASESTITLPEDDPETIGALIEFLYTGSYTYTFKPVLSSTEKNDQIPISDVTQGTFHVAVYAVASKYGCESLVKGALSNFTYMLTQLTGLDVITLWKAAYVNGLNLSQFESDPDLHAFMKGLPELVGDAYGIHEEEMHGMVAEYPALASDLLRLVTRWGR